MKKDQVSAANRLLEFSFHHTRIHHQGKSGTPDRSLLRILANEKRPGERSEQAFTKSHKLGSIIKGTDGFILQS
jgi:hypothetical protein